MVQLQGRDQLLTAQNEMLKVLYSTASSYMYASLVGCFPYYRCIGCIWSVSFGSIVTLFTKDIGVLAIARTGVLFVSASQPLNAFAFIVDGLHYGVSDFPYAAYSMMLVGILSSAFLFYTPSGFGLHGVWSVWLVLLNR
uniref:Uncharacterized protein n=1 Tax=Lactuca sativa TaxID=4236 RepID=A0A9R1VS62_LACSA|nr:hypothetical protein LSAT_V11C400213530 [Lactuca sativa]